MEAMFAAYAKKLDSVSTRLKQNMTQTITEYTSMWMESAHRLRRTFYFADSFDKLSDKGAFEMRHSFVSISFRWYAFPNFCTQISRRKLAQPLSCSDHFVLWRRVVFANFSFSFRLWTDATCVAWISSGCAPRWASCRRSRCCSAAASRRTSLTETTPAPSAWTRSRLRPRLPTSTVSSTPCPRSVRGQLHYDALCKIACHWPSIVSWFALEPIRATIHLWVPKGPWSLGAKNSGSLSRGPSCGTPVSCCWTKPRLRWTPTARR